jgi:phage shock protein PspC (stress-responsive transcriptional regulator)
MERRFMRRSSDKVIGGICSGLAVYVGADLTLVRVITLFGIIASGVLPGLLLYLICLIIVPLDTGSGYNAGHPDHDNYSNANYEPYRNYGPPSDNARYVIGIGLIAVGVFLFARMFFAWLDWKYVFAGLLILGGLFMIFNSKRRGD